MGKAKASVKSCSFCGKSADQVNRLVAGPGVFICDECIKVCNTILLEDKTPIPEGFLEEIPTPKEIKEYLDYYVVGQDYAKKTLSVAKLKKLMCF